MYMLLFSESETSEASYFSRADVIEFLHRFHKLEKHHEIRNENLIKMLSDYYKYEKCSYVRAQKTLWRKIKQIWNISSAQLLKK
jgi:hypothetical protein